MLLPIHSIPHAKFKWHDISGDDLVVKWFTHLFGKVAGSIPAGAINHF